MRFMMLCLVLGVFVVSGCAVVQPEAGIPSNLLAQVMADNYSDNESEIIPTPSEISFRAIDLNSDGIDEYILQGNYDYCGNRGCSLWIYRKVGDKYSNIYFGNGVTYDLSDFETSITRLSTNGFPVLIFKSETVHVGEIYFIVSYFDGEKYIDYRE